MQGMSIMSTSLFEMIMKYIYVYTGILINFNIYILLIFYCIFRIIFLKLKLD